MDPFTAGVIVGVLLLGLELALVHPKALRPAVVAAILLLILAAVVHAAFVR